MVKDEETIFRAALVAFLVLPGTVAFLVPWLLVRPEAANFRLVGLAPLGPGIILLVWCVRDFFSRGGGTLAPWRPPKRLVTVGPYRRSRNPMYVAVLLILVGWALAFASPPLWLYTVTVAVAFHLRILLHEEPWLARTFGEEWSQYRSRVPRWLL